MSAFLVHEAHIAYLIEAATSRRLLGRHDSRFVWYAGPTENPTRKELHCGDDAEAQSRVGAMLWSENWRSVCYRYPDDTSGNGPLYVHRMHASQLPPIEPAQVLKACDCLEYQSCEHPEWETSEASAFLRALRRRAWQAIEGYEGAAWAIDSDTEPRRIREAREKAARQMRRVGS